MKRSLFAVCLAVAVLGLLAAPAIAGPYLTIHEAKKRLRHAVLSDRDVYDWRIHHCFHLNRSKVRCRIHVWASASDTGDYECNVLGQVRATWRKDYTQTYGAHCY